MLRGTAILDHLSVVAKQLHELKARAAGGNPIKIDLAPGCCHLRKASFLYLPPPRGALYCTLLQKSPALAFQT